MVATKPSDYVLPSLEALDRALNSVLNEDTKKMMKQTIVVFEDELKKGKDKPDAGDADDDATESDDENAND